jgi:hypothetical protein
VYIIQCTSGTKRGLYLKAARGQKSPYTNSKALARKFHTREEAQAECCPENEVPVEVDCTC